MLNENAKAWVAALRSGQYEQGRSFLRKNDKHCCLGVACELAIEAGLPITRTVDSEGRHAYIDPDDNFRPSGHDQTLPPLVKDWLGLRGAEGEYEKPNAPDMFGRYSTLSHLNDSGQTFVQIADVIESEPEGLFKAA